ncbi:MAG: DUF1330 domain-containing protein [Thiohalocapsa sp.]
MPAYLIAEVEITDPAGFSAYVDAAVPTLAAHNARLLANGKARAKEGTQPVGNIVVIEFPSIEAAERWYSTPPYKDAIPLRQRSANTRLFFVEGAPH